MFRELETISNSIEAKTILDCPSRFFNTDETGLNLCPKTGKSSQTERLQNMYENKKASQNKP